MAYEAAAVENGKLRKGPWLEEEDERLTKYVRLKGDRRWDALAKESGLRRSGRSCRLRWLNYLRPNLKHGHITVKEENSILQLHEIWGNKWSKIARMLPGRTDNEIKNYWRTHLVKKAQIRDGDAASAGNLQSNKAQQGYFFQEGDDMSDDIKYDFDQYQNSIENIWGAKKTYSDDLCFSDFALPSFPYETRVSDWISELSSEQSGLTWTPDHDCDAWDYSSSLWDMN
ncbi:transcription factor MYB27-like [Argentina anserina]|uniref:transcription factor MYB27-like n=1 Tax=Argentina anserina TaxID=57926 RepID=UPI0021762113|nr:transcription factor MYB27-like [Potentilla anserina]